MAFILQIVKCFYDYTNKENSARKNHHEFSEKIVLHYIFYENRKNLAKIKRSVDVEKLYIIYKKYAENQLVYKNVEFTCGKNMFIHNGRQAVLQINEVIHDVIHNIHKKIHNLLVKNRRNNETMFW